MHSTLSRTSIQCVPVDTPYLILPAPVSLYLHLPFRALMLMGGERGLHFYYDHGVRLRDGLHRHHTMLRRRSSLLPSEAMISVCLSHKTCKPFSPPLRFRPLGPGRRGPDHQGLHLLLMCVGEDEACEHEGPHESSAIIISQFKP
jgi:hypothetical protein